MLQKILQIIFPSNLHCPFDWSAVLLLPEWLRNMLKLGNRLLDDYLLPQRHSWYLQILLEFQIRGANQGLWTLRVWKTQIKTPSVQTTSPWPEKTMTSLSKAGVSCL
jgi:hypothetical protein